MSLQVQQPSGSSSFSSRKLLFLQRRNQQKGMTSSEMKTLPVGLNDFVGEMGRRDWGGTFAAITIAILPTIIVYFILNKQVMEGMAAGAVKS